MLTIDQLGDIKGKRILVRVDFNVPLKDGQIRDDNRIVQAAPTIKSLVSRGAKVILLSHLGKIKHKDTPEAVEEQKKKNNLAPVATRLSEIIKAPVAFCPEPTGELANFFIRTIEAGEVVLLQNTRYEKGEEKNDPELAKKWAENIDIYVMDAFGSAHRAHSSTYGIPEILKAQGKPVAVGYLVEKEIRNLTRCVEVKDSDRPYIAILGGFKVSDKIKVIDSLLKKCDKILIGGAMAYTFAKAIGRSIGKSPCEDDQLEYAKKCYEEANGRILLPLDSVATDAFEGWTKKVVTDDANIPEGFEGMDIGPKTATLFQQEISKAKMVFWNGPMGVFEQKDFATGTIAICEAVAKLRNAFTVCGGGDSAAAVSEFGYSDAFSHVSTGGGASLEMIENDGHLPGIDVLK
ncbi:MAG: phosphoglycerate kinase [Bacteroidia bacterium]|nr:phosphoglycerate kinase [Bacteroidia bacterium]